ncbi:MAG TPA: lipopolysaccharide transport periplasmic protein LptA, partial [Legionellaceae bacterium]|nr:lipopolysaccharide transport periplasmic protein LptA [Legionellaceae bacterium]
KCMAIECTSKSKQTNYGVVYAIYAQWRMRLQYQKPTPCTNKRFKFEKYHYFWLSIYLCITQLSFALPEDRQAVLMVQAGSADLNQTSHMGTYQGGIALDQGSTHIRAAKAFTYGNHANQLIKAVIEGDEKTQAHYWSLINPEKPFLHAYADKIIYYPLKEQVTLIGHARIEQGPHKMEASVIQYDLKTQHVVSQSHDNEQTIITIHPEKSS